jgi:hypothetical protein
VYASVGPEFDRVPVPVSTGTGTGTIYGYEKIDTTLFSHSMVNIKNTNKNQKQA